MNCDEHQLMIRAEESEVQPFTARVRANCRTRRANFSFVGTNNKSEASHTMVLGHDGSMFPSLEPTVGASTFATCISDQTGNQRLARNEESEEVHREDDLELVQLEAE